MTDRHRWLRRAKQARRALPPGAGTKDPGIPGTVREAAPYEEAPAEGHLATPSVPLTGDDDDSPPHAE